MKIAICEDDLNLCKIISDKIKVVTRSSEISTFNYGNDLLEQCEDFQLVYLDIQLPDITGIELAQKIREINSEIIIIFITAFHDYVYDAFDVNAFHYLLKPIDHSKFYKATMNAINKIKSTIEIEKPSILIKTKDGYEKIVVSSILYAEAFGRKIKLQTKYDTYEFYGKFKELILDLGFPFVQIHRSYIVNLRFISSYNKEGIILENGISLYISKKKYAEFISQYLKYIKSIGEYSESH
ncbi:MAG: LytR/AlgR family response regulator transcription factor [Candidatus Pristimantibacillus sp.]